MDLSFDVVLSYGYPDIFFSTPIFGQIIVFV